MRHAGGAGVPEAPQVDFRVWWVWWADVAGDVMAKKKPPGRLRHCRWCKRFLLSVMPTTQEAPNASFHHCDSPNCDWCLECYVRRGGVPRKAS